ncbi:MAG: hypothetical protein IT319_21630 [Anaerolineae bacterium]|nr:hypothetical protein [Anaerolineae bacterium]
MPLIRLSGLLLVVLFSGLTAQQPTEPPPGDLSAEAVEIVSGIGGFGQPVVAAVGQIVNASREDAYTSLSLSAQAFDADNTLVGEGIGVLVNACGVGVLPDFALQPESAQAFSVPLELHETNATIDRVEISAEGQPTAPTEAAPLAGGITQITDDEAVNVEWIDDNSFRFSTGCETDLFNQWTWYSYNRRIDRATEIAAPHADDANETMRARLELEDDDVFAHSMMRFAPDGDRVVYQNARNDFLTAYITGTFRRGLYIGLHSRTLQGIYWQPDERFIAYYYGAYGDPVYYFVADAEARTISPSITNNPPSVIVPGLSRDGRRVVVAGEFDGVTGYYLYVVTNGFFELQFEAEPPGNNYPAPIPLANPETDLIDRIYVALPVDGKPRLQCFNRDEGQLHNLAPLPLNLADDERAWWWISPGNSQIALAADGVNGGLWLIDLTALPDCVAH